MNPWTDYLVNSHYINAIYHENKPSLNNVDIHEIIFHRDGPKITIRMNLEKYPDAPPKKWIIQKFNTVQITLSLIDVECVNMSGWVDTTYAASINIEKKDGKINFVLKGLNIKLMAKSSFIDIETIAAYTKS